MSTESAWGAALGCGGGEIAERWLCPLAPARTGDGADHALLRRTNALLRQIGLTERDLPSLIALQESASSMCVGLFERIFGVQLEDVRRNPAGPKDYEFNAEIMLQCLRDLLREHMEIPAEVTAERICRGDLAVLVSV